MSQYCEFENNNEIPTPLLYPDPTQRWMPSLQHPFPMNFVQAPSASHQVLVYYNGKPQLQGLSTNKGPVMFPLREVNCHPKNSWERKHTICPFKNNAIVYPTTHSVPGPFLQSYIALPNKMYAY
jgi:hypothetical protein